jgi:hypothetical protein
MQLRRLRARSLEMTKVRESEAFSLLWEDGHTGRPACPPVEGKAELLPAAPHGFTSARVTCVRGFASVLIFVFFTCR